MYVYLLQNSRNNEYHYWRTTYNGHILYFKYKGKTTKQHCSFSALSIPLYNCRMWCTKFPQLFKMQKKSFKIMFIPYPVIRFFLSKKTFHSITNNGEVLWDISHALNIKGIRCLYIIQYSIQTMIFRYQQHSPALFLNVSHNYSN